MSHRGLSAVYAAAGAAERPTAEELWARERVIEALMEDRDLLPVRYGSRLPDEPAVARVLEERHDELAGSLGFVSGAAEVSVRVLEAPGEAQPDGPDPPLPASGTEYLRARARREQQRVAVARSVHEPLLASSRAGSVRAGEYPGELLRAAYLVERDRLQDFAELVARLAAESPQLRLISTGPWPPYSFAGQ